MLKCNEIVDQATDYVDKQLNWKQAMNMALHLLMCRNCRRFIHYFRLSLQILISRKTLSAEAAADIAAKAIAEAQNSTD
tara:strand:- start:580 stop:816 length:237 start_codon:yes stop_codon:yes gene_type:complete